MKTQTIRLIDVFLLGPFMIWAGTQLKGDWAKAAMIGAGILTITYNARNYRIEKALTHEQNDLV